MARNGLLTMFLTLGFAACFDGGTPTSGMGGGYGASGPTEPASPADQALSLRDAAQLRVAQAVEQLQNAQTAAERASATLRRDAALADVTALSASVDLEAARLEVRAAAAAARAASTGAERSAALKRLQAAEARLAPIIQAAARGLKAARSALASDSADAAAREAADAVLRRATEILQRAREFQTSARAQIATARRLVAEATGSGSGGGSGSDGGESAELEAARQALSVAETAVGVATAAVTASRTRTSAATRRARDAIAAARTTLDAAVSGAQAAVGEARSSAALGAATRVLTRARSYRTAQGAELDRLETSLSRLEALLPWYQDLERISALPAVLRQAVALGAAHPNERTNAARIVRTPRTIPTSATDDTPIANPDAFTSTTFEDVMHAAGKEVFFDGGDEFKVDGYVTVRVSNYLLGNSITGLKLTNGGLVIRTGITTAAGDFFIGDFTDMRKDITTWVSDSNNDGTVNAADGIPGQNGWDLTITFDEPQTVSVPGFTGISGSGSNWRGNNAFYWKSLVPADESQKSGGANYQADAFNQPSGRENLGTYEVWLSNGIGVNGGSEPAAPGSAWVICPDGGTRWISCPDDVHRYLNYAAYGLFVYSADTRTFLDASNFNGQRGRINTIHFGYSAFANEDGQRIADIDEAITDGTFTGYTLAYEVKGSQQNLPIESKLLRGDVTLTVNIPKGSGAGSLQGTMNNFQQWNEESEIWTTYVENFAISLSSAAIGDSGTFRGTTQATPSTGFNASGAGVYKGGFYGPRADVNELEIAGSWTVGSGRDSGNRDLYGSFGAKQDVAGSD